MNFFKSFHHIFDRVDLNLFEKVLYSLLVDYQNTNEFAWPAQETLAIKMSVSKATIKRTIKGLETKGILTTKRFGHGRTNRYQTTGVSQLPVIVFKELTESHHRALLDPRLGSVGALLLTDPGSDLKKNQPPTSDEPVVGGGFFREIPLPEPSPEPVAKERWRTGWREWLKNDKEYQWEDGKDAHAVFELEEFLATSEIAKERFDEMLNNCWDDYFDKNKDIQSIPAILVYRLRKLYGNRK